MGSDLELTIAIQHMESPHSGLFHKPVFAEWRIGLGHI
jgi:hypothetical protein